MTIPLQFDVFARDRASRPIDNVGNAMDRTGRKAHGLNRAFTAVGRVAAVGVAAGFAAAAVGAKKFYAEADEARKVGALTAAAIKSTGGAANVTGAQVEKLATSISQKVGVDDEAIQSGANLLLTFKNIRNEVGAGNKVFDRATKAAVDLSAAGFGDLTATSKQLGKALNDPVKGVTALGRAGVTFSEQQKQQIERFVQTGKILKAQKLILNEVTSQVGGAAASQATPLAKLKVTVNNIAETIGGKLLPVVDRAANWLASKLPGALNIAGRGASVLGDKLGGLARWFTGDLMPAIRAYYADLMPKLRAAFESITGTIRENKSTFVGLGRMLTQVVLPTLGQVATLVVSLLGPAFKGIVWLLKFVVIPVFAVLAAGVITAFRVILDAATWAFGWIPGIGPKLKAASAEFSAFADRTNAALAGILTDVYTTVHVQTVISKATHNEGFIGPTIAESLAARGIAGPYTDAQRGVRGEPSQSAAQIAAKAAKAQGKAIGTGLASGLESTASKVGDAGKKVADAAKSKFDDLKAAAESLRDSVKSSVLGFFSLQTEGNPFAGLSAMANKAVRFANALGKLARQGVNPAVISMIAQAGPDVGYRAALMLSTAGKANRNRIDNAYGKIAAAADRAGNTVANAQFGDQLGVAKRSERHLKRIADAVTKGAKGGGALANGWAAY